MPRGQDPNAELDACVSVLDTEFDFIYQTLRRRGLSVADAEDVVQDVFLVMWRRWTDYDRRRSLRAWLTGIAFRVAYHHRSKRVREVPGGVIDAPDERPSPEEQAFGESVRG